MRLSNWLKELKQGIEELNIYNSMCLNTYLKVRNDEFFLCICLVSFQNVSFFNCFFSARADHTEEERERIRHSLEILEKMSKAPDSKEEEQRREEEKEQLRAWMMEKRHQRMEEYKKHMTDLREHERRPFKPDTTSKFKVTHIHNVQHLFVK